MSAYPSVDSRTVVVHVELSCELGEVNLRREGLVSANCPEKLIVVEFQGESHYEKICDEAIGV